MHDLRPDDGAERRILGGLEHHGAARGESRYDFRRDLIDRPIPGRDQRAHAHGFLHQPNRAAHFFEFEILQHVDHRADVADANPRLRPLGESNGRAHFNGNRLHDFFVVGLVGGEDSLHEA